MKAFGWRKKVARLQMVVLACAPQLARELPPEVARILDLFARAAVSGDARELQREFADLRAIEQDAAKLLWEPVEVYGWRIYATMYLCEEKLWWLIHATRQNEQVPSDKDVLFLDKVLERLGAEPRRHMVIGPTSAPVGEPRLPFGWWTWQNVAALYEVQLNKHKVRDADKIRIVALGSGETDGYRTLDLAASTSVLDDREETP
jgi:hypothetical protein